MNTHRTQILSPLLIAGAALFFGCAGAQKKPSSAGGDDDAQDTVASAPGGGDLDVVTKPTKQPDRKISDDQRAEFEKALAVYQKMKRAGTLKGGACDDAASAFRRAADQNADLLEARHNEAAVYMECGRKEEAARIWEKMANAPKPFAPAIASLGFIAWQRGDAATAETLFNRAIQTDQQVNSISARLNLAQILRDRARRLGSVEERRQLNDQAIRHLRTVLALDGNSLQAYATLCYIYFDLGLPDAAILIGRQATKRAEEIATGKFDEEVVEFGRTAPAKKGKGKAAASDEPKTAKQVGGEGGGTGYTPEMKKQLALVFNTMGLVSLNKKVYAQAISDFKKAVDNDPELHEARLNLAAVSLKFRNYGVAEENFRAVLAAQPKNYEAIIGLGVALRGNRKYDEAEQQYLAAQKLDPQRSESYFNLGLLYQEYKGSDKPVLQKAQQYYRDYLGRADESAAGKMRKDAEKRIKDIDELFVALEEAAKLQKEAEELQRKAEEQQKKMEEEMKRMQEEEKKAAAAGAPAAGGTAPPAGGAAPAAAGAAPAATTPPPATAQAGAPKAAAVAPKAAQAGGAKKTK